MKKKLDEHGEKITEEEKVAVKEALEKIEAALAGDSKSDIETALSENFAAFKPLYDVENPEQNNGQNATQETDSNTVDADFTEVKREGD
jgi:molecular chaperone DnaK